MPDYPDTAFFTLAPDWACEVLSPSTRRIDLHGKRPIYAREGVGHLWLVDPADRTMEAFELREEQWVLIGTAKDDDPVCIPPSTRSPSASPTSGPNPRPRSWREGILPSQRAAGALLPESSPRQQRRHFVPLLG